jgi:hypothetical protein
MRCAKVAQDTALRLGTACFGSAPDPNPTDDRLTTIEDMVKLRAAGAEDALKIAALHAASRGYGRGLLEAAARSLIERGQLGPLYLWVFEVNWAARRFYARTGGAVVEKAAHSEPDGSTPLAIRYVWSSAKALLDGAASGAQSAVGLISDDASGRKSGSDTGS